LQEPNLGKTNLRVSLAYSLGICFAPSLADSFIFLTLTRLVVVFIFVNFSFALFTPPLGDYHFHVDLGGLDEGNHLGMPEDGDPPRPAPRVDILQELVVVPVPAGGQDAQLEQIREVQARLDDEAGQLVQLWQNIGQEWAG
jgi:hypothetical protein